MPQNFFVVLVMDHHLGLVGVQGLLDVDFMVEVYLTDCLLAIIFQLSYHLFEVLHFGLQVLLGASIVISPFFFLNSF